ncbi:MAG: hypothetical protein EBW73_12885, partial [Betaproteobacteria bacterium]|nr:hypothetical protein [Betaproteobacteria bacterium]
PALIAQGAIHFRAISAAPSSHSQRARAPLQILDTSHVATSFPGFVRVAQASGMRIEASSTTA